MKAPYFLTAILLVRIYAYDKAELSSREMVQWLQYLRFAGFEHVYVYDAFLFQNESQKNVLDSFIKDGFVTYIDWHEKNPYSIDGTQHSAYQHCLENFGGSSTWQSPIDIDEYPFSPSDTEPNFLQRFLKTAGEKDPEWAEITMNNFLMLGKPLSPTTHPLLIDRIFRRDHS